MIQFHENHLIDRRIEGQKDEQNLFHGTLPATARGPKWGSTNYVATTFWAVKGDSGVPIDKISL